MSTFSETVDHLEHHGKFPERLTWIRRGTWKPKPKWFPYQGASSTLGSTVYLGKGWYSNPDVRQRAAHLLHEGTHIEQWHTMGKLNFMLAYSQKAGRLRLEQAAVRWEFYYWVSVHQIQNPANSQFPKQLIKNNPHVSTAVDHLATDYLLGQVDREALYDWALTVVKEAFEKGYAK